MPCRDDDKRNGAVRTRTIVTVDSGGILYELHRRLFSILQHVTCYVIGNVLGNILLANHMEHKPSHGAKFIMKISSHMLLRA